MPLSKSRDRERKRRAVEVKRPQGLALLSRALIRSLRAHGISPERYISAVPVSLDSYRALQRRLEAKEQRVQWQSSGIRVLQQELAQLRARLATLPAMQDTETLQRIAQLEAGQVLHEVAAHNTAQPEVAEGEPAGVRDSGPPAPAPGPPQTLFGFLHPRPAPIGLISDPQFQRREPDTP